VLAVVPVHEHFDRICDLRELWPAEIARRLAVNPAAITRLRQRKHDPGLELVRGVARILEVTIDFLAGAKGHEIPTRAMLARESLELFLRTVKIAPEVKQQLDRIAADPSSPVTIQGWRDHMDRVALLNPSAPNTEFL
jgi:transcriptional regulator with XRE-family HTH domain